MSEAQDSTGGFSKTRADLNAFLQNHVQLDHQTRRISKLHEKLENKSQLLSLAGSAKLIRAYENSLNSAEKYQASLLTALNALSEVANAESRVEAENQPDLSLERPIPPYFEPASPAEVDMSSRTQDERKALDELKEGSSLEFDETSAAHESSMPSKDQDEAKDTSPEGLDVRRDSEEVEDRVSTITESDLHEGTVVSGVDEPTIESGPELDSGEAFTNFEDGSPLNMKPKPNVSERGRIDIVHVDASAETCGEQLVSDEGKTREARARSSRRIAKVSPKDFFTAGHSRTLAEKLIEPLSQPKPVEDAQTLSSSRKRIAVESGGPDDSKLEKYSPQNSPAATIKSSPAQMPNANRKSSTAKASRIESPIPIGSEVAVLCRIDEALENDDWILATILNYNSNGTFEVEDVEDSMEASGDSKASSPHKSSSRRLRFSVGPDRIRVIPAAESAEQDSSIKIKDRVLALFPGTTCLYPATVVSNPSRRKKSKDYLVSFSDDSVQHRAVPARYVLSLK